MKKKMLLDAGMTLILVALMKTAFTGVLLHELLGLFVFCLFLVHKVFNWKWIRGVTAGILSGKSTRKARFLYGLDVILLLQVTFIVTSGIIISDLFAAWIKTNDLPFWSEWHHFASYSALVLISVHLGLHWQSILNFFKKLLKFNTLSRAWSWSARALTLLIVLAGSRSATSQDTLSNLTAPFTPDETRAQTVSPASKSQGTESGRSASLAAVELSSRSVPTLQEYLSKLYCTGCSKRCPLTALRCSRGTRYKNAAVAQYNSLYGENSSNKGSTSPAATPGPGSASNSGFGSNSGTGSASGPQNTPIDFIAIMGLFVAGTHYTVTIPKNLSHALRAVPASD